MSIIGDLRGEPQKIKLKDKEILFYPLDLNDMAKFASLQESKQLDESIKFLIKTSIKKAVPEATDDEIINISPEVITQIIPKILEINGFRGDSKKLPQEA